VRQLQEQAAVDKVTSCLEQPGASSRIIAMAPAATTLRPSTVLAARRDEVLRLARVHGASNVRVFGSVARGQDTAASDVDLLVDFPAGTSLLAVIGLQQALGDLLGVPVDVGPSDALRADLRDRVFGEARAL